MDKNEKMMLLAIGVAVYNIAARMANRCEDETESNILSAAATGIYAVRKALDPDGKLIAEIGGMVDAENLEMEARAREQAQGQVDDTDEVEDPTCKLN